MKVLAVLLLLCGGALAASPRGEFQKSSDTPAEATAVVAPAEVAPAEGIDEDKRDKRWFPGGGFNPNPYSGFYPNTWWGNNYGNYAPVTGGRGRPGGMSPFQMQQYMQQMHRFSNNLPAVINTGAQFGPRGGVRPNSNILPDVIDTGARGVPFLPMPMLHYMYSNGFAPPFKPNQQAFFQHSWQQYFSQFTNRLPGTTFDLRPQREVTSDSVDGMGDLNRDSSYGSPVEDTMTGSGSFSGSA